VLFGRKISVPPPGAVEAVSLRLASVICPIPCLYASGDNPYPRSSDETFRHD